MATLSGFASLDHRVHLFVSLLIRIALIKYGTYHDSVSQVKYTDIDYKVFTDAARHVLDNKSPFERHTYRYSPLLSYLVIPNILLHPSFGKVLFSLVDLLVALLIKKIVTLTLNEYYEHTAEKNLDTARNRKKIKLNKDKITKNNDIDLQSNTAMLFWLYNPLNLAISTRGNCDSIAVFFVLATLYMLQCQKRYFLAGLIHGLSIHFRLYPIIYSLAFYMYLSKFSYYSLEDRRDSLQPQVQTVATRKPEKKTIFKAKYLLYVVPNLNQIWLVQGCILSLFSLVAFFYYLYGNKFIHEAYLYHFIRKDTRHSFSFYFYLLYITAWIKNVGVWQKVLIVLPQLVLQVVFSFRYGLNKFSLNFCVLVQTIVMVAYNTVLTSQYFVWVLGVLPLCLWQIQISKRTSVFLLLVWFAAQGAWLLPAYLLEFHGQNTFFFIWIQSVSFFCANIAVLGRLIMYFRPMKLKDA